MATLNEHLQNVHQTSADFHDKCSKAMNNIAECYKAESDKTMKTAMVSLAEYHDAMSAFHSECADAMGKAVSADLAKVVPLNVSTVGREDVPMRAVARTGSPDPAKAAATVDPRFRHLLSNLSQSDE